MTASPSLKLLAFPYDRTRPVTRPVHQLRESARMPGSALVWSMDPDRYRENQKAVQRRPGGLALIVVLPPARALEADAEMVSAIQRCRPHGLLPYHQSPAARDLAQVLRRPPLDLPAEVTDYLSWRGLLVDRETVHLLRRMIELSAGLRSITAMSRSLYLSRRALGRRLMTRGLPVPSHWLQIARVLRFASELQNSEASIASIAYACGYPDGFSVSNQMQRLIGFRPSQVRERLGWEWIMEAWLRREAEEGGLAPACAARIHSGPRSPAGPPVSLPAPRAGRPRKRAPA